jgi:heme-degrading monooxygenase HmoA
VIAVIFEVVPVRGRAADYFRLAGLLRPELEAIEGFVSIERCESLTNPGKILSLSFWRDEKAIAEWRNRPAHRGAQEQGRMRVFADYRLRIAEVRRDCGMADRREAPKDSRSIHKA